MNTPADILDAEAELRVRQAVQCETKEFSFDCIRFANRQNLEAYMKNIREKYPDTQTHATLATDGRGWHYWAICPNQERAIHWTVSNFNDLKLPVIKVIQKRA